jgi:hypothetical protein
MRHTVARVELRLFTDLPSPGDDLQRPEKAG